MGQIVFALYFLDTLGKYIFQLLFLSYLVSTIMRVTASISKMVELASLGQEGYQNPNVP